MEIKSLQNRFISLVILGLIAAAATLPAAFFGIPSGPDLSQHFQFAAAINDSLTSGEVLPVTSAKANHGLGDYGIRFYPPLSYYGLSFIFQVLQSWYYSTILFFFLAFWFSGIGVTLWAREYLSRKEALFAGALFIFAPYHLNQIYNSFLFAEFAAIAIVPFCLLFITRVCKSPKVSNTLGLAFSLSFLFLTHLPTTVMCVIIFPVYSLILLYRSGITFSKLLNLGLGVVFAVVSTSFYWIKVLTEQQWINHSTDKFFNGVYGFRENFLGSFSSIWYFQDDVRALWLPNLILFVTLVSCLPTLIMLIRSRKRYPDLLLGTGAIVIISVFLTTFLSQIIWEQSSIVQKLQFPWRFLGFVSIGASVFASAGIIAVSEIPEEKRNNLLTIGLGLVLTLFVFSSAFIPRQATFIAKEDFSNDKIEKVQKANSYECWWTIWVPKDLARTPNFYKDVLDRRPISATPKSRTFQTNKGEDGVIELPIYYYPHWEATSNGKKLSVVNTKRGLIGVEGVDQGSSILVSFREPKTVVAAYFASLGVWCILFILLSYYPIRKILRYTKNEKDY